MKTFNHTYNFSESPINIFSVKGSEYDLGGMVSGIIKIEILDKRVLEIGDRISSNAFLGNLIYEFVSIIKNIDSKSLVGEVSNSFYEAEIKRVEES